VTSKSKGSSIRQKLISLSRSLGIPYQNLETSFLIERLVARLTAHAYLNQNLVFKGGFVGLRVYHSSRYTVDLDALIVDSDSQITLTQARKLAESDLNEGFGSSSKNRSTLSLRESMAEFARSIALALVK
jgi:predicted nucleotidyltransferase component of viral defense system